MINPWLIVGGTFIVALLIGAAFVAGRLLKKLVTANEGDVIVMGSGNQMEAKKRSQMERSEELSDRAPDVTGMMQKVENNSIFVAASIGPVNTIISKEGGQMNVDTQGDDATTVEVAVTKETRLYKDASVPQVIPGDAPADKIEQKIFPAMLDELKGQAIIAAWGERKGDRLIAEVVLCTIVPKSDE